MTDPRFAVVVLAGGGASRMGGVQKLLEPVGGDPMARRATLAALGAEVGPVVVVTGDRGGDVAATLPQGATVVHNPAWSEGMSTSLAAGVRALPGEVDAFAVGLADMPLVTSDHFRRVFAAWAPGVSVVPTRRGEPGHPVVIDAGRIPEVLRIRGDRGARAVLGARPNAVRRVALDDLAIVTDVDDPSALARVRSRVSIPPPPPAERERDT